MKLCYWWGNLHSMNLYDDYVWMFGWVCEGFFAATNRGAEIYSLQMPMTPQAKRAPALPVDLLNSCPPSPKSSGSAWTTTVRPKMLCLPDSEICLSLMSTLALPESSAMTFPKSPACRTSCVGPPCSLPCGLKCGPALMQPLVLSPNSWMWKPCKPAFNPVTSPETLTGSDSDWKEVKVSAKSYASHRHLIETRRTIAESIIIERRKDWRSARYLRNFTHSLIEKYRSLHVSSKNADSFRHFDSIYCKLECSRLKFQLILIMRKYFAHGTNDATESSR